MTAQLPSHPANRPSRTGGRLRSQDAHDEVLRATADILEEAGYAGVTIEGVAARAAVAKSTIYRWWKSKAELVMEAYSHTVAERMPEPDTNTLSGDLAAFTAALYQVVDHPLRVRALRGMMAEAQLDPAFEAPFRNWVQSRRAVVARLLTRGIERGELPADLDLDYATDLIFGPFWYRLLVGHAPLDPAQAPDHIYRILHGLSAHHPNL